MNKLFIFYFYFLFSGITDVSSVVSAEWIIMIRHNIGMIFVIRYFFIYTVIDTLNINRLSVAALVLFDRGTRYPSFYVRKNTDFIPLVNNFIIIFLVSFVLYIN